MSKFVESGNIWLLFAGFGCVGLITSILALNPCTFIFNSCLICFYIYMYANKRPENMEKVTAVIKKLTTIEKD